MIERQVDTEWSGSKMRLISVHLEVLPDRAFKMEWQYKIESRGSGILPPFPM